MNAVDYLLKPFTIERFNDAISRARERLRVNDRSDEKRLEAMLQSVVAQRAAGQRLAVRLKEGVQVVRIAEIDWLQADGNYTQLHIGQTVLRMRETLSELEAWLVPSGFARVHRSIIVNIDRVFRLEPWTNGEYLITLRNGKKINSGRGYGERVRSLFS